MSAEQKTVGVIGGLGPEACVDFMATVLRITPAKTEQEHVRMLVEQNPQVPNRQDAILRGGENPAPALADAARRLGDAGCDFIVMPCNTAHAWEAEIRAACSVPFVSIIDVSVRALPTNASAIGILASPACMAGGMFQAALEERGKQSVVLDEQQLGDAIKRGETGGELKKGMLRLADDLVARGADALISGCTEIPIVLGEDDVDVPLVSSTGELARTSIAMARGEIPLPEPD